MTSSLIQLVTPEMPAADTLRVGAIKINNNFQISTEALSGIYALLCDFQIEPCMFFPKTRIIIDVSELNYTNVEPGDVIYRQSGYYDKASAQLDNSQEAIGVVYGIVGDDVYVCLDGYICDLTGLVAGKQYYLSPRPQTPGTLVTYEDLRQCDIMKPICTAISSTEAIIEIQRASFIGADYSAPPAPMDSVSIDDIGIGIQFDISSLSERKTLIDDISTSIVFAESTFQVTKTLIEDISTSIVILSGTSSHFENEAAP
jgi:hypothetical protein